MQEKLSEEEWNNFFDLDVWEARANELSDKAANAQSAELVLQQVVLNNDRIVALKSELSLAKWIQVIYKCWLSEAI